MSENLNGLEVLALKNQLRVSLESILMLGLESPIKENSTTKGFMNYMDSDLHLKIDHEPVKIDFSNVNNLISEIN